MYDIEPWHLPHQRNRPNDAPDTIPGHYYPACVGGPCAGGTRLCPSAEACQLADEADGAQYIGFFAMLKAIFWERK